MGSLLSKSVPEEADDSYKNVEEAARLLSGNNLCAQSALKALTYLIPYFKRLISDSEQAYAKLALPLQKKIRLSKDQIRIYLDECIRVASNIRSSAQNNSVHVARMRIWLRQVIDYNRNVIREEGEDQPLSIQELCHLLRRVPFDELSLEQDLVPLNNIITQGRQISQMLGEIRHECAVAKEDAKKQMREWILWAAVGTVMMGIAVAVIALTAGLGAAPLALGLATVVETGGACLTTAGAAVITVSAVAVAGSVSIFVASATAARDMNDLETRCEAVGQQIANIKSQTDAMISSFNSMRANVESLKKITAINDLTVDDLGQLRELAKTLTQPLADFEKELVDLSNEAKNVVDSAKKTLSLTNDLIDLHR